MSTVPYAKAEVALLFEVEDAILLVVNPRLHSCLSTHILELIRPCAMVVIRIPVWSSLLPFSAMALLVRTPSEPVVDRDITMLSLLNVIALLFVPLKTPGSLNYLLLLVRLNAITLPKTPSELPGMATSRMALSLRVVPSTLLSLMCRPSALAVRLLLVIRPCTVVVPLLPVIITKLHRQTRLHRPMLTALMALPTVNL